MKPSSWMLLLCAGAVGCATTYPLSSRFVSRTPNGGIVATPSAEQGMRDANAMIAAHCGRGGFHIDREGEQLVGATVITENAQSVDARTTEESGQVQGQSTSRTMFGAGSQWQMQYTCSDPSTVNMGLVADDRVVPSPLRWGVRVGMGELYVSDQTDTAYGVQVSAGYQLTPEMSVSAGYQRYVSGTTTTDGMTIYHQDVTSQAGLALINYDSSDKLRVRLAVGLNRMGPIQYATDYGMLFDAGAGYQVMKLPYGSGIYAGVEAATQLGGRAGDNVMPLFTLGVN